MDWIQFSLFFIAVCGLFIWNRTESRADIRYMDAKLEANQKQVLELITAIKDEMKDFHGRLCAIEERNRK